MVADPFSQESPKVPRREGFPGQRLIVLPAPVLERMRADPLLQDLFVTATGHFPNASGHYVERRKGIEDAILIRVLHGVGWIEAGARQEAAAGDVVVIAPKAPHAYGADSHAPWQIEWIHFQGHCAQAFVERLGAKGTALVAHGAGGGVESPPFSAVYEALEKGYTPRNLLRTAAHLRSILTELHTLLLDGAPGGAEERVRKSMEWMLEHPGARTSLAHLAKNAGLSIPHYCGLLKRLAGFPPMEHLRRLNIQRACQLLDTSKLQISEIAARLGWEDPLYFSRCFRRITGKSPRAWRKAQKG